MVLKGCWRLRSFVSRNQPMLFANAPRCVIIGFALMMPLPNNSLIEDLQKTIEELRSAKAIKIADMKRNPIYSENTHQGIYAITNPDDLEVVYIGKTNDGTKENGVADRIYGHCESGSDLRTALDLGPKQLEQYIVRTLPICDAARRGLSELYGIAIYGPRGNRYGRRGVITDLDEHTPPA